MKTKVIHGDDDGGHLYMALLLRNAISRIRCCVQYELNQHRQILLLLVEDIMFGRRNCYWIIWFGKFTQHACHAFSENHHITLRSLISSHQPQLTVFHPLVFCFRSSQSIFLCSLGKKKHHIILPTFILRKDAQRHLAIGCCSICNLTALTLHELALSNIRTKK